MVNMLTEFLFLLLSLSAMAVCPYLSFAAGLKKDKAARNFNYYLRQSLGNIPPYQHHHVTEMMKLWQDERKKQTRISYAWMMGGVVGLLGYICFLIMGCV